MALLCLAAIEAQDLGIFIRCRIITDAKDDTPAAGPAAPVQAAGR